MKVNAKKLVVVAMPLLFLVAGAATLKDYGISWDEPAHFFRGQAQVDLLLTGDFDYKDLAARPRKSIYQDPSQPARFFFHDSGHPPINGTLAALFNRILYQDLGVMGDIESLHLFNVAISAFLVFVVVSFATRAYGVFPGIVAGLVLGTYPLFFGESHFNIKDPAEAAFFAATIWCLWRATERLSWKWLLGSVLFFSLGLGTKFNILFLPFVMLPYLAVRFGRDWLRRTGVWSRLSKKFVAACLLSPFLVAGIFIGSWVYLWQDPVRNTESVFKYYRDIGTAGEGVQQRYLLPGGWNAFPVIWVVTTTPPLVLVLGGVGMVVAFLKWREKEKIL